MRFAVLLVVLLAFTGMVAAGGKPPHQKPQWLQTLGRKVHELEGTLAKLGHSFSALGKKVVLNVKGCVQSSPVKPALQHATACIINNVKAHANSGDVGVIAKNVLACEKKDAVVMGALKTFVGCLKKNFGK